jgi:ribosomal protein S6
MVLYDLIMVVKTTVPKVQMAEILKRTVLQVLDTGGVVTDITNFGASTLAYPFRKPGELHFEVSSASASPSARTRAPSSSSPALGRQSRLRNAPIAPVRRPAVLSARRRVARSRDPCLAAANLTYKPKTRSKALVPDAIEPVLQGHTLQVSFNVKPQLIENLKHTLATDERVLRWMTVKPGPALKPLKNYPAGAYTRSLFSSTCAVSDTKQHPTHPKYPLTSPQHGLHDPHARSLSHIKRSS